LWGESSLAEQFNDIGRKLLSAVYDPKSDRQPTADEAADAEMMPQDRQAESRSAKAQPKSTELAALEQTVQIQKSTKQGTGNLFLCLSGIWVCGMCIVWEHVRGVRGHVFYFV